MIPQANLTKLDGAVGVAPSSLDGVCAVVGPSVLGTVNQPFALTKLDGIRTAFGSSGKLSQAMAFVLAKARKPVVGVKCATTTAAAYGTVTKVGTGTFTPTAGATPPDDDYPVLIKFLTAGTVGTAGITYQYSLNNGRTFSAVIALGTANSIVIPGNITIQLGAGTVVVGDQVTASTTSASPTGTDIVNALEALRITGIRYEAVLWANTLTPTEAAVIEAWNLLRQPEGRFRHYYLNARVRGAVETRAAYLTAMQTLWAPFQTIDGSVGYDGAEIVSPLDGSRLLRPTSWVACARAMSLPNVGVDPAYMQLGQVAAFIQDDNGNPLYHDEATFPGADDLGFTTLRTAMVDGVLGVYLNNVRTFKLGSDFRWLQQARVVNKAAEIVYSALTKMLSLGVETNPPGAPGAGFITEPAALNIETNVNSQLGSLVVSPGLASYAAMTLSRSDNVLATDTLTAAVEVQFLGYVKTFSVTIAAKNPAKASLAGV